MASTTTKGEIVDGSSSSSRSGQQHVEEDIDQPQPHGGDETKTTAATTTMDGTTNKPDWRQQQQQQQQSSMQSSDDTRSMPASLTPPPSKQEVDDLDVTSHHSTSAVAAPALAHDSNAVDSPAYSLSSTGSSTTTRSISSLSEGDSSSTTDCASTSLTLTPPSAPSVWYDTSNNYGTYNNHQHFRRRPPLVVSAKRLGADVRRQHSKRRRRRPSSRRVGHHQQQFHNQDEWMMDSLAFINPNNESGSKTKEERGRNSAISSQNNDKEGTIDDIEIDPTNGKRLLLYGNEEDGDGDFSSGGVLAMAPPATRQRNRNSRTASSRDRRNVDDSSTDDEEENGNGEDYNDHFILFDPNQFSRDEANKKYWEWCYGSASRKNKNISQQPDDNNYHNHNQNNVQSSDQSFSASRDPPRKGCLRKTKPTRYFRSKSINHNAGFRTPPISPEDSVLVRSSSSVLTEKLLNRNVDDGDDGDRSTATVKASNTFRSQQKTKQVQFGSPSAVEYVIGDPAPLLTPLPNDVIRKRYSMDQKKGTVQEEEMTAETKQNNSILAQWEDAFDNPNSIDSTNKSRRRKSAGSGGRNRRGGRREGRRSSSIFSPTPMSLVNGEEGADEDRNDNPSTTQKSPPEETKADEEKSPDLSSAPSTVSEVSPSVIVSADLASLKMSPGENTSPTITTVGGDTAKESPGDTENTTWEGYVDLGSVNVSGGAMEVSPPTPAANSSRTEGPISLPQADGQPTVPTGHDLLSPSPYINTASTRRVDTSVEDEFRSPTFASSITTDLNSPCLSRRPPTPAVLKVDVSNATASKTSPFLQSPRLEDQNLAFAEVLRKLLPPRSTSPCISNLVETALARIDPSFDWLLQYLDDLMSMATSSPIPKNQCSNASMLFDKAEKYALSKWDKVETEFLENLTKRLVEAESELFSCSEELDQALISTSFQPSVTSLKRDIEKLESKVIMEDDDAAFSLSSLGRHSGFFCQATEQLCIHGFCIEKFEDSNKELSFALCSAPNGRYESRLILNLESTDNMMSISHHSSGNQYNRLTRQATLLTELSGSFLSLLLNGSNPLLYALLDYRDRNMQDIFLKIARWYGMLELLSRDLAKLDEQLPSLSVYIALPHISLTIPNQNLKICVALDPVHDSVETEIEKSPLDVVSLHNGISDWRLFNVLGRAFPDLLSEH